MKRTYWRNGGSFYEQEIYIAPYNEGHQDETMLNNQKWKQSKMLQMRRKWKELFQRWSGKVERRHKITPQVIDYDGMEIIKVLRDEKMNPKDYIMLYFPFIKTDAKLNVLTAGLLFCPQWYRNYIHQFQKVGYCGKVIGEEGALRPGRQTQDDIFSLQNILEKSRFLGSKYTSKFFKS